MLDRRRLLIANSQQGGNLPSGYTRVNYVYTQNPSGAYAVIPFSWDDSIDIELNFIADFTKNNLLYQYENTNERFAILIYGTGTDVGVRINGTAYRAGHTISDNAEHTLLVDSKKLYLDGTEILDFSSVTVPSCNQISIFGIATASGQNTGYSKFKGYKGTKNGTVLINLVPCLDNNDVPCIYDTVGRTTHYSQRSNVPFFYG